ncbi:MAG: D-alanyl-D-alanine carboxypeptidase, partial [Selenomonadaceae bacterium]
MLKKIIAVSAIFMLSLSSVYAIEADADYTDTVQQAETADAIDNESDDKDYIPADDELPDVTARNAVVIEAATGKVLYQRNKDIITYPASTTKIMTLIMALEHGNLDQQ